MIVPNQIIKTKWSSSNKKYYTDLGYTFTKIGDEVEINLNDLTKGARQKVQCICDYCGERFYREYYSISKKNIHFCGRDCSNNYMKAHPTNPSTKVDYNCDWCNKHFKVKAFVFKEHQEGKRKNIFCSRKCHNDWQSDNYKGINNPKFNSEVKNCLHCDKEFLVPQSKKDTKKYCSDKCKRLASRKRIKVNCGQCGKELLKHPSAIKKSASGKVFCSNECVGKYNSERHKINRVHKICLICGKHYYVKPSEAERSKTCSKECQHKWQSIYLTGENANSFNHNIPLNERTHKCDWCGKSHKLKYPWQIKASQNGEKNFFCSEKCYRDWYAKEWSQSEEWKEISRKRAVSMLNQGIIKTDTWCQIEINNILNDLDIKYENEFPFDFYSVDNYLSDYNLIIEVMGTYWHCDRRIYKQINYELQLENIKNDKKKRNFIKNKYGIDILYIWEYDIDKNKKLVVELIKQYIENHKNMKSYHSFDYMMNNDSILSYNKLHSPYMDLNNKSIDSFVELITEKKSRKQSDKWIRFKCENCGKETEQLISHYSKNKTHCCSRECKFELKRKK